MSTSHATTKVFLDTEFIDTGRIIKPISIALVAETGAEYYAVFADADLRQLAGHAWLNANVAPQLPVRPIAGGWTWNPLHRESTAVKPRTTIAQEIVAFFTALTKPQLWAYFSPFDTIVLTQLYGPLNELPNAIPAFTHDLMQEAERTGIPTPRQKAGTHHALLDARHNLTVAQTIGLLHSPALSSRHEAADVARCPRLSAGTSSVDLHEGLPPRSCNRTAATSESHTEEFAPPEAPPSSTGSSISACRRFAMPPRTAHHS